MMDLRHEEAARGRADAETAYYRQKGKKRRKKDDDDEDGFCASCFIPFYLQVAL